MISSVDVGKSIDNIQHPTYTCKNLSKLALEVDFLNMIRDMCQKQPTGSVTLDHTLQASPCRVRTEQGCSPNPFHSLTSHQVAQPEQPDVKEREGVQRGGEASLFPDHMVVHAENPEEYTDTLLKLLRQFGNVARYELNNRNQLHSDIPEQIMRK